MKQLPPAKKHLWHESGADTYTLLTDDIVLRLWRLMEPKAGGNPKASVPRDSVSDKNPVLFKKDATCVLGVTLDANDGASSEAVAPTLEAPSLSRSSGQNPACFAKRRAEGTAVDTAA